MVITRGFPSLVGSHDATKVGSASGDDCERGSALLENETKGERRKAAACQARMKY